MHYPTNGEILHKEFMERRKLPYSMNFGNFLKLKKLI